MSLGENIRKLRIERNISQTELANIVGCSDKTISAWENDTRIPRNLTLIKMADYFNISLDFLTGRPSTPSELWRSITLPSHIDPRYIAQQMGIPTHDLAYLEHSKDDKVSKETYSKLVDIYRQMNTQQKIDMKELKKASVPDVYNLIEDNDLLRYKGEDYDLDETTKEKLHTAVRLALM
jgi:transcriptional regulator with XRE-family HTH domain